MRGFTLIEILAALAVILMVLTVIIAGLSSFRRSADLNRGTDGVLAQLRDARRFTIESKDGSQWGAHAESSKTVLFKGAVYDPGASDNELFILPRTVTISTISLEGGGVDVVFRRISGGTDQFGTLTLVSVQDSSKTKIITIHASGLVETQ